MVRIQGIDFHNSSSVFSSQCLASTTAFGFGCSYIAKYEEVGEGIQWHNIARSPVIGDDFNMAKVILIMLADAIIYWLITCYVEAVKPG